jgi:hypothetical protein
MNEELNPPADYRWLYFGCGFIFGIMFTVIASFLR